MKRDTLLKSKTLDIVLPSTETVKVRGLKRGEVVQLYNAPGTDESKGIGLAKHILTHCLLNDDGTRMFGEGDDALIDELDAGDAAAVVLAVQKLSGMVKDEAAEKKA